MQSYWHTVRSFSHNARMYMWYTVFSSTAYSMYLLVLNLYVYSLGYRQDFIGLVNAVPSAVILALGLPVGVVADRWGYRWLLIGGTVMTVASGFGLALTGSRLALLLFSALSGIGGVCTWVIGMPFLAQNSTPRERVELFSVNFALMMGSGLAGSLLAGFLPEWAAASMGVAPDSTAPLRVAMLAAAALGVASLLPLLRVITVPARPQSTGLVPKSMWLTRPEASLFVRLLLPAAIIGLGAGMMVTFFQLFFRLRFDLLPGEIGILFGLSSLVTGLASLLAPLLVRRLGKVRTVVWTQLMSIPFLLILAYSGNLAMVIAAYYLRAALMNMNGPVATAFALEMVRPDRRATLSSLEAMVGSLGRGGLGPLVSGFIQVESGFTPAFTVTTVLYVVATLLFYAFFRHAEQDVPGAGVAA